MPDDSNAPDLTQPVVGRSRRAINDERVGEIITRMSNGTWVPGRSHRELSALWGISEGRVRDLASQASRIIMMSQGSREDAEAALYAGVAGLRERALSHSRPDFRTALGAYELIARLQGLIVQKHEAKVQEVDSFDVLPPEELASKLEAEAAALRKQSKGKKK